MDAKLVVVGGEARAAEVKLKLPTIIGRGREATLTLPHPLVSRQHCEIFELDGRLFVRDLGSLNGTFVNNEKLEGERELPSGNLLTIGTVTFRAVYEPATANVSGNDGGLMPHADGELAGTATVSADDLTVNNDSEVFDVDEIELEFTDDTSPTDQAASNTNIANDDFLDSFLKDRE